MTGDDPIAAGAGPDRKAGSTSSRIAKAASLLAGLQLLTQGTGLLKQLVIAALFGTSAMMDAYFVALGIIDLVQVWISLPIRQVLIPMFRHDLAQRGEQAAWTNFNLLFNNFVILLVAIALVGWLAAPYLVSLTAPGFTGETWSATTSLARIVMPSVVFIILGVTLSQLFYSYERFLVPGLVGVVDNIVMIVALFLLAKHWGIYGLAAAVVLGDLCLVLFLLPVLWTKRRFTWSVDLRHPKMTEMGKLSVPLLLTTGGQQLSRVTDRLFGSLLSAGSLSALTYGGRLVGLVNDLVIDALQQSTFPHFAKLGAERRFETMSRQLFSYLRVMFFLTIPIATGIAVLGDSIVAVVYQRGAFGAESTRLTSLALICYALGFPASAAARVLNRTYFSMQDTWTPTRNALGRFGLKIVLSAVLVWPLGLVGLALADSISHTVRLLPLFSQLPAELRGQEGRGTFKSAGRSLAAAALMAIVVHLVRGQSDGLVPLPLQLLILVILGAMTYGSGALLLGAEEPRSLWNALPVRRTRTPKG